MGNTSFRKRIVLVIIGALMTVPIGAGLVYLQRPAAVLAALLAMKSKWNETPMVDAHECTGRWSIPVTGKDSRWIPAFPETNAAYFLLPVQTRNNGRPVRFVMAGDFPMARFMSLALYDSDSGRLLSSLRDSAIKPYSESENPFLKKVERDTPDRRFVVRVAPLGYFADQVSNKLTFPKDVDYITLILRVYRPDDDAAGHSLDATGGVGLPRIHAYHVDDGTPAPGCLSAWRRPRLDVDSNQRLIDDDIERDQKSRAGKPFPFYAHHPVNSGLFPNPDVTYGFTNITRSLGDVVSIRFKAPSFFNSNSKTRFIDTHADVRYWSVCLSGRRETNTVGCVGDAEMKVDKDGFANVVIIPRNDKELAEAAAARGMSVLNWGKWITGGYRVIVRFIENENPFAHSYSRVPDLTTADWSAGSMALEAFEAGKVLGDYAATGTYMSRAQFLESSLK